MNLKKILSAVAASAFTIGTLAVNASAAAIFITPEGTVDPSLSIGGNWLIQLYNTGNPDENKPAVDRNVDVTKVASLKAYVEILPTAENYTLEDFERGVDDVYGGAMIWSANGGTIGSEYLKDEDGNYIDEEGNIVEKENRIKNELYKKYNWPGAEDLNYWWGFPDKDDTYEGRPQDQGGENTNTGNANWNNALIMEYVRPFGYTLTFDVPDDLRWISGATCYQIGVQMWGDGSDYFSVLVDAFTVNDDNGNVLVAFDGLGNELDEAKLKEIVDKHAEDPTAGNDTPADTEDSNADNTAAGDNNTVATEGTPSDANITTSTDTAPSNNSNVGLIAGIVAGIVVIGGGIGVVSFLRKK